MSRNLPLAFGCAIAQIPLRHEERLRLNASSLVVGHFSNPKVIRNFKRGQGTAVNGNLVDF
jgi:hypothetical protein